MKKTLLFCSAIIIGLMSCKKENDSLGDTRDDTTQLPSDNSDVLKSQSGPAAELGMMTVEFTVDCANEEIGDLLKKKTLKDWSKEYALGGTIHKDDFFPSNLEDTNKGVMMWYTFEKIRGKDRIVMAFELSDIANIQQTTPHTQNLKYPENVFSFDPGNTFNIVKHANAKAYKVKEPMDQTIVYRRMGQFDRLINDPTNYDDEDNTKFNESNGAFFQNNPQPHSANTRGLLSRLVNQKGADSIRYYFAYRKHKDYKNRIRIILVATNKKGENMVPEQTSHDTNNKSDSETTTTQGLIVQKSIPPGGGSLKTCP